MKKRHKFSDKITWPLLTVALSLLAAYLIFGVYFTNPNGHMFAFGGDSLVIYFDMLFHIRYGEGLTFSGMNYPFGEYIFLTDMQGALTLALKWIHEHIFQLDKYTVGIIHSLNQLALPVASAFVFYILRYFNVRKITAVLFAVLIVFLSPQMLRYVSHYGLAYPFVIPMSMLWVLRKKSKPKFEKRDVLFFLTLLFFTFNNPYIGFCSAGFILCMAVVLFFWNKKEMARAAIYIAIIAFLILLIPYLNFKISDPVNDRIVQQWGFFHYRATFEGLFLPPGALLEQIFRAIGIDFPVARFASRINLGLVGSFTMVAILYIGIKRKIEKRAALFPLEMRVFLLASFFLFFIALNYTIYGFAREWMENLFGPLLMFKDSGRLAWPFYFSVTIASIIFLDKKARQIKNSTLSNAMLIFIALIWAYEIKEYIGPEYANLSHSNYFSEEKEKEITDELKKHHIDISEFQALLTLPKIVSWNDNVVSGLHWQSQFYALRLSAATGVPLVNAQLSRMSTKQAIGIAQLYSHSLIEKELPDLFPNQKDLLLLLGKEHPPLESGEQFLLDQSDILFHAKNYSLYRLPLERINKYDKREMIKNEFPTKNIKAENVIRLTFDEKETTHSFYGKGAGNMKKGKTELIREIFPTPQDTSYLFSAWTRVDHQKYGVGKWEVRVFDSNEKLLFEKKIDNRIGYDYQDGWVRASCEMPTPAGAIVQIYFDGNRPLEIDEVMLRPKGSEIYFDEVDEKYFLYNGFKIRK